MTPVFSSFGSMSFTALRWTVHPTNSVQCSQSYSSLQGHCSSDCTFLVGCSFNSAARNFASHSGAYSETCSKRPEVSGSHVLREDLFPWPTRCTQRAIAYFNFSRTPVAPAKLKRSTNQRGGFKQGGHTYKHTGMQSSRVSMGVDLFCWLALTR